MSVKLLKIYEVDQDAFSSVIIQRAIVYQDSKIQADMPVDQLKAMKIQDETEDLLCRKLFGYVIWEPSIFYKATEEKLLKFGLHNRAFEHSIFLKENKRIILAENEVEYCAGTLTIHAQNLSEKHQNAINQLEGDIDEIVALNLKNAECLQFINFEFVERIRIPNVKNFQLYLPSVQTLELTSLKKIQKCQFNEFYLLKSVMLPNLECNLNENFNQCYNLQIVKIPKVPKIIKSFKLSYNLFYIEADALSSIQNSFLDQIARFSLFAPLLTIDAQLQQKLKIVLVQSKASDKTKLSPNFFIKRNRQLTLATTLHNLQTKQCIYLTNEKLQSILKGFDFEFGAE